MSRWYQSVVLSAFSALFFFSNVYQLMSYSQFTAQLENSDRDSEDSILTQLDLKPLDNDTRSRMILLPNGYPRGVYPEHLTFQKERCLYKNCLLTDNAKNFDRADAVLFQGDFLPRFAQLKRDPSQIWIYFQLESPVHSAALGNYSKLFNWTATYRRDSTIVTPYAKLVPHISDNSDLIGRQNRTKLIAWFVSNCDTTNNRWSYVQELMKFAQVDIYGACGRLKCSRDDPDKCNGMLARNYKFYLAFENSNCVDYITEKFFYNALGNGVVPVVMGARKSDYARVAPPMSFIHVDDFDSPKHLVDYLHFLDSHQSEYDKYLEWRTHFRFIDTKFWCRLCAQVNRRYNVHHTVDVDAWWRKSGVCERGRPWAAWRKKSSRMV